MGNFDFFGFTHYMGKSRKGKLVLKHKTSSGKLTASLKRLNQWLKDNRHRPTSELVDAVNLRLRGIVPTTALRLTGEA